MSSFQFAIESIDMPTDQTMSEIHTTIPPSSVPDMPPSSVPDMPPSSVPDMSQQCSTASVIYGSNTTSVSYFMHPMGLDECDSRFIDNGWYQYPGGQNIPTHPVIPGQCGTNSPIYLQGTVVVTLRCYDTSFIHCKITSNIDHMPITIQFQLKSCQLYV